MFATTGAVTGVDLGSRNVKLVRARRSKTGDKLLDACIEELPQTTPETWESEAAKALGRILKSQKLSRRELGRVAVAVSGASVHLRQVDLPALTDPELKASMKYEARKHLPLESGTENALDCQVIDRPAGAPRMSVLFAGAPDGLIKSRVKILERAGIEPEIVDVAPLALLNGLYAQPGWKDGDPSTVALMDLGASSATIVMSRRGGVVYSRTVAVPGPAGAQPATGDSPEGAFPGIPPETLEAYARALAAALRETAQFYASMNARRPVETIHLAGGNALLPGLDGKLSELLGLPVSPLDLTRSLHYSPPGSRHLSPEALHRTAPQLAVALGLLYWGNGDV